METLERRIFFDDVRQLDHQGLDASGISFEVGALHQVSIELLVAETGTQALTGRPAGSFGIASLEAKTGKLVGGARDVVLEASDEAFDVCPGVAAAGDFERSTSNQLERCTEERPRAFTRLALRHTDRVTEALVVGADRVGEPVDAFTVRQQGQVM